MFERQEYTISYFCLSLHFRKLYKSRKIAVIKEVHSMKKGSLDISIQAIIIVVLGMTLLGLGLGFVRTQFEKIGSIGTEVQDQVREQIIGQLRTSGEQISFPREVNLNRGKRKVLTLGVQNVGSQELFYKLNLQFDESNSDKGSENFDLRYQKQCLRLLPAEADVHGISVEAPRAPGTFALRVDIGKYTDENCVTVDPIQTKYATKLSFITVG